MSTLYLIDLFSDNLVGVETPANGQSAIVGQYVVRVPQGISVRNPVDLTDLLNQKYDGIFGSHAGFANIVFDDFTDATGVDIGSSSGLTSGKRNSIALYGAGVLLSNVQALGSMPTQAIFNLELFEVLDSDQKTDLFIRTYKEIPVSISDITCQLSFNNGATFLTVNEDSLQTIPIGDQGNQLVVKLTNITSPARRLFLGGWSVVY